MTHHSIAGGGGVQLHVVETGNPDGHPIVFVHGFSQSSLAWRRQLDSDLADHHRLVAIDLRGHGRSNKPRDAYADSKLWADDVNAVLQTLHLDRPILCGWSYGPIVMLDYVRHYGEGAIAGMIFVAGVTELGSEEAFAVLTPEFLALVPGTFSNDIDEGLQSMQRLLQMCMKEECAPDEFYLMLGYNLSVPPHVRRALLSRSVHNDDLLPTLNKPVLIVHGEDDRFVKRIASERQRDAIPHARLEIMPNVGHAPFWEDAATFNRLVHAFSEQVSMEAVA